MLREQTLLGVHDKAADAIERLRHFEPRGGITSVLAVARTVSASTTWQKRQESSLTLTTTSQE
jgi:hypothetical protein